MIIIYLFIYFFFFKVLLSPPIVVYSPRVLPVYVYDAHADCGKNVRFVIISLDTPFYIKLKYSYSLYMHLCKCV